MVVSEIDQKTRCAKFLCRAFAYIIIHYFTQMTREKSGTSTKTVFFSPIGIFLKMFIQHEALIGRADDGNGCFKYLKKSPCMSLSLFLFSVGRPSLVQSLLLPECLSGIHDQIWHTSCVYISVYNSWFYNISIRRGNKIFPRRPMLRVTSTFQHPLSVFHCISL